MATDEDNTRNEVRHRTKYESEVSESEVRVKLVA